MRRPQNRYDLHWPARVILGAAAAAALAGLPQAARADSLLYTKGGEAWIAHADGSAARPLTTGANGWAWPSMADDGTVYVAGGRPRVNPDGSDTDGSDLVYHLDQAGRQLDPPVTTYGTYSTPSCPTYAPWNLRVSPDGLRVSYNAFFCDNMDSFVAGRATGASSTSLISENYLVSNWLDAGHILITHQGPTFGNASFAEYDIADPASSHGPSADPYLPDREAASSRSGNRVAVYEDDPLMDGSGVAQADIRVYDTNNGDITDVNARCTITLDPATATTIVDAAPTFSPDGTRLAWGAKDGIHHASTTNLADCSTVRDAGLLVPGGAEPFYAPADEQPAPPPPTPTPTPTPKPDPTPKPGPNLPKPVELAAVHRRATLSHRRLTVRLKASRTAKARLSGALKVGHRRVRLAPRTVTLHAGRATRVTFKLSSAGARRVRSALRRHAHLKARLTVVLAGRTVSLTLRLR